MFCSNCGSKIPDGAKFCANCGQFTQPAAGTASEASTGLKSADPVGGKKRKGLIMLAAVIAFAITAGLIVKANIWRFMSAKAYYGYLESRSVKISLNKLYKDAIKAGEVKPFSKDIVLTIDSITREAEGDLPPGLDLKDFSLNIKVDHSKSKTASYVSLDYMDNKLLDALLYQDKNTLGLGVPLLHEDYFMCDPKKMIDRLNTIRDIDGVESSIVVSEIMGKTTEQLKKELDADTKLLDKRLAKYFKTALDSIPGKNFKKDSAGDVTIYSWASGSRKKAAEFENCRTVTFTVAQKDFYVMVDRILTDMEKDGKIIDLLSKYGSGQLLATGAYGRSTFGGLDDKDIDTKSIIKAGLAEARENLDDLIDPEDDETAAEIRVIADKDDNIISRMIIMENSVITLGTYTNKEGFKVTELNFARDIADEYRDVLYLYKGEEGAGLIWSSKDGINEISYTSSGEGKSDLGIGYGTYKLKTYANYSEYEINISADKDKNTDVFKLRLIVNDERIGTLSAVVKDLKDKSKLGFNKKKAIDITEMDKYELEEIAEEIGYNFQDIFMERMEKIIGG